MSPHPPLEVRIDDDPGALPLAAWNALLAASPHPTPFMRLEYLQALHDSGSAVEKSGWAPQFFSAWDGPELVAACPAYLKTHSYGEYVFDWAWAEAHARHGLAYYPKLLVAVPFTPVPGSRLLARDAGAQATLIEALRAHAEALKLSSAHVLFPTPQEQRALIGAGWLGRSGVQFHWEASPTPPTGFEAFLASLQRDKRKKIQQEQRRVREAGVSYRVLQGDEIRAQDWDFFHRCYRQTYAEHRSTPYLSRDFFRLMADGMARHWLLFIAELQGEPVACSLIALDPDQGVAYGRYWGSLVDISCLHFDACYYQPLAWCMARGYRRFEGGAQGEHKLARGLMPIDTHSTHWLAHPDFRDAVADYLAREGPAIASYAEDLRTHQPFKRPSAGTPDAS
ncbi:N-acetyltransferase [Mitsuaria sp. WAJ17]|uniref:GNAT family N-acetyltransferase n=1 Tax=Mitsuaria sp. WAJ17 TaxID=2761452 RepID=UPI0016039110|nr:GNAT family N-acetyltransferase [Mitsuaria sp. WAJ17]MBB2486045.1 N-acetyltransferase [Mitsuaria sp. WAJ17]